jgi:L-amino acid N-acyltransferase YncA
MIRPAVESDADAIARIYNHYVLNTTVTFEEDPVSPAGMAARIAEVEGASLPWLVLEQDGQVLGYAYASKWKGRCAYRYSVETTVYLAPDQGGRGYGTRLYEELFARLRERGLHAAIGGIALPNPASVALHERMGMSKVAHFKEVGFKFGRWIDVGYWEKLL